MPITMPSFIERTTSGSNIIPADTLLQERRVIFLMDPIDRESASKTIMQLVIMNSVSDKPITLVIGSPGGDIQWGLAILDTISASHCVIKTLSLGLAASMGSVLLAAGTPGFRYCSHYSRVMIHEPLLANGISGSCSSIQETAKQILERKNIINDLLSKFTQQPRMEVEKATAYDHFYSAEEAAAWRLVDHVAGNDELMELLGGINEYDLG